MFFGAFTMFASQNTDGLQRFTQTHIWMKIKNANRTYTAERITVPSQRIPCNWYLAKKASQLTPSCWYFLSSAFTFTGMMYCSTFDPSSSWLRNSRSVSRRFRRSSENPGGSGRPTCGEGFSSSEIAQDGYQPRGGSSSPKRQKYLLKWSELHH